MSGKKGRSGRKRESKIVKGGKVKWHGKTFKSNAAYMRYQAYKHIRGL